MLFRGSASTNSKCICKYTFNYFKTWNKNEYLNVLHIQPWQLADDTGHCCQLHLFGRTCNPVSTGAST